MVLNSGENYLKITFKEVKKAANALMISITAANGKSFFFKLM